MSGYDVLVADNGEQALELMHLHEPDLILLDLWLPGDMDGMSVCAQVRRWSQVPIIVVSAKTDEKQKVQALDKGADDYLTKPFNNDELLARVRACLRRAANVVDGANVQQPGVITSEDGYVSIDLERRLVRAGTQEMKLTPTEFELLHQLMLHAGKVMTHRTLLRSVWGPEYGEETDYLRVYVRQLRRKIEQEPSQPKYILTEPGVGYVFGPQVIAAHRGEAQSAIPTTPTETQRNKNSIRNFNTILMTFPCFLCLSNLLYSTLPYWEYPGFIIVWE